VAITAANPATTWVAWASLCPVPPVMLPKVAGTVEAVVTPSLLVSARLDGSSRFSLASYLARRAVGQLIDREEGVAQSVQLFNCSMWFPSKMVDLDANPRYDAGSSWIRRHRQEYKPTVQRYVTSLTTWATADGVAWVHAWTTEFLCLQRSGPGGVHALVISGVGAGIGRSNASRWNLASEKAKPTWKLTIAREPRQIVLASWCS
jgi:hypothetical protein